MSAQRGRPRGVVPARELGRLRRARAAVARAERELVDAVAAAQLAGGSVRAIADELDVSPSTIVRLLEAAD